jgi:hypothetical protein
MRITSIISWTTQLAGSQSEKQTIERAGTILLRTLFAFIFGHGAKAANSRECAARLGVKNRLMPPVFDAKSCRVLSAHSRLVCYLLRQDAAIAA